MKRNKLLTGIKNNASTILTVVGAVGVVGTAIFAVKETPKAKARLEQARKEKGAELTKLEVVVNATPAYLPAIGIGFGTIACIFGANVLDKKKQASLLSAYSLLAEYHNNYRRTLINLKGKEVDEEIKTVMAREHFNFHALDIDTPDTINTYIEEYTGQSLTTYERVIMDAEYHFNRNFILRGYATLNEWLEMLGLEPTEDGDEIGWCCDREIYWIDFEHQLVNHSEDDSGPRIYNISMIDEPEYLDC